MNQYPEFAKDKSYDLVQVHSLWVIKHECIAGFAGVFSWINNSLKSLDGDIYSEDMLVHGFEEFEPEHENYKTGLDILVEY